MNSEAKNVLGSWLPHNIFKGFADNFNLMAEQFWVLDFGCHPSLARSNTSIQLCASPQKALMTVRICEVRDPSMHHLKTRMQASQQLHLTKDKRLNSYPDWGATYAQGSALSRTSWSHLSTPYSKLALLAGQPMSELVSRGRQTSIDSQVAILRVDGY